MYNNVEYCRYNLPVTLIRLALANTLTSVTTIYLTSAAFSAISSTSDTVITSTSTDTFISSISTDTVITSTSTSVTFISSTSDTFISSTSTDTFISSATSCFSRASSHS